MELIDDGDLIPGLGFVALYAAYLEEAIDECLNTVSSGDVERKDRLQRWPMSKKIKYIKL